MWKSDNFLVHTLFTMCELYTLVVYAASWQPWNAADAAAAAVIVASTAFDETNRKQCDMCHAPPTHTHTHIYFYNQTDSCVCCCSLSLTQTAQLQIKLILRKLLPTECGCAIVLFALTNCFCFSAEALELGSSSLRVWGGMSSVVFSSSDCSLWLSGTLYDDFLQWLCNAFFVVVVRKLICAFYVTLLLLALTRY